MKPIFYFVLWVLCIFSSCRSERGDEQAIRNLIRINKALSDDAMEGRAPFTQGEELACAFLIQELKNLGFEPAFDGSYEQRIELEKMTSVVDFPAQLGDFQMTSVDQLAISSPISSENIEVKNSELVFCGFGIDAPEYDWNDFKTMDVKGKTIVVLVNDPGLYAENSEDSFFRGNETTLFGRWTYKFEEAARRGAEAVLIIHETKGAGYGYNVPRMSALKSRFFLAQDQAPRCKIQGWIERGTAERIFQKEGYTLDDLIQMSCSKTFQPFVLHQTFSAKIRNTVEKNTSKNIGGILKGSKKPDEAIVVVSHWDHFGIGEPKNGDSIYNGAVDNAVPMAWAIESCRLVKSQGPLDRSLILLFPTCEEEGLLGSHYYCENPAVPLNKTLACLNTDIFVPKGKMNDVTLVGFGYSFLDSLFAVAATKQGRYIMPHPYPEQGLFFRGDQFAFYKRGVPSIWFNGCFDSKEKGKEWAKKEYDYFISNIYHTPLDNYNPRWDWSGVLQDCFICADVIRQLDKRSERQ